MRASWSAYELFNQPSYSVKPLNLFYCRGKNELKKNLNKVLRKCTSRKVLYGISDKIWRMTCNIIQSRLPLKARSCCLLRYLVNPLDKNFVDELRGKKANFYLFFYLFQCHFDWFDSKWRIWDTNFGRKRSLRS